MKPRTDASTTGDAGHLRIQLLGGFRVSVGPRSPDDADWRLRKAKALVKLLALAPGHILHREQLLEALWPGLDPAAAANNLHRTLYTARRALEPSASGGGTYLTLREDRVALAGNLWVDVEAFEAAAAAARQSRDAAAYRSAIELYRGDLLPEDRYEDWAAGRLEELRDTYLALLVELARACQEGGDLASAIDALQRVVASDPAHEEAHVGLVRLHALRGQRHEALRQYHRLRQALRRELDAEPQPASEQLYQDILAGRWPPAPAEPVPIPAFQEDVRPRLAGLLPLVGRDDEVERLEEALDRLFSGRGRLVLISGEAGVGKTRLALEVAERARRRGARILMGAAYEQERQLPYGLFREAVSDFARRVSREDLAGFLGGAGADLIGLVPPGVASADPSGRQRLFAAVERFLVRLAAERPAVLVLDDLHAADEGSLQLLHYLARTVGEHRVLLVATLRDEEAGPSTPLGELLVSVHRERRAVRIALRPLDASQSVVLVTSLLDGDPVDREVFDAVYAIAEGNPFYTEEAVRALREDDRLYMAGGDCGGPCRPCQASW